MRKKICLIILCVVSVFACAFGLVACGVNGENNNNNTVQDGNNENLETYTPTEGLKYTDKGSYYELTGIGTATDTEIFIAKTYNGKPVTSIGQSAFSFINITSVTIPDSITKINDWAFSYSGLTSITIPDSVTSIGFGAFDYCESLTSATIGKGVTSVGANVFLNCSSLNSVTINEGLKYIGTGMFQDCSNLKSITIPNGVTIIDLLAFSGCSSLTSITIPNSVKRIDMSAFSGCNNLIVYFTGSEQDWNEIDIGAGNNELINAPRHYNSVGNENSGDNGNNPSTEETFTIKYLAESGGHIVGTTSQTVKNGENGTSVTAVADEGYSFIGWSDNVDTATRQETNVTQNISVIAYFEKENDTNPSNPPLEESFTITYTAENGGHIIGTVSQTVKRGENGTAVIAVADEGYEFIEWSDGVQTAERQEKSVNSNIDVIAYFDVYSAEEFAGGAGTEENPYLIVNQKQLKNIEKYPSAYFKLDANVELSRSFTPLLSDEVMFNGTLDGNGHKIVGLAIYNTTSFYTGMFACIGENGVVKNLTLENVNVQGTNYVGAIAGYSLGTITDITVSGQIIYLAENAYMVFVGGIVGRAEGEVNRCRSDVSVICENISNTAYVGGIAGYLIYSGEIAEMHSTGDVKVAAENSYEMYGGGLFGYLANVSLSESTSTGNVTVTAKPVSVYHYAYAGGIAARYSGNYSSSNYSIFKHLASSGNITANISKSSYNSGYAAGLFGYMSGSVTLQSCFAMGNISGDFSVGGLIGYTNTYTIIENCHTTGNITGYDRIGGLIGQVFGGGGGKYVAITYSYTTGNITGNYGVGGLIGYNEYDSISISACYTTGTIEGKTCIGGLAGYANSITIGISNVWGIIGGTSNIGGFIGYCSSTKISNSYAVSEISLIEEDMTNYMGGLVGYGSVTLTNVHWLYISENGIDYAVGYNTNMGVPTNIGATRHNSLEEFYALADILNEGLDEPAWEQVSDNALPTLKQKEE